MAQRVSPSERIRAEIDALFSSDADLAKVLEQVGRFTVRLVMQQALESEVDVFLGRARYKRRSEDSPAGSRNGSQPAVAVKTTMGPVELSRPKLRGTDERFCSQLFGVGVTRANALETLVISAWVRGLSDRDVEAALKEVRGEESAHLSTVSRICQQVKEDFDEFSKRDLSRLSMDYLFLDGTNFRFHEHSPAEPRTMSPPPLVSAGQVSLSCPLAMANKCRTFMPVIYGDAFAGTLSGKKLTTGSSIERSLSPSAYAHWAVQSRWWPAQVLA